jgi:hypothetical protein
MSDPNPYAPPGVDESEAPSAIHWQCCGERVMARNGAMLPKVDLETGASDEEMTSVARSYQAAGAGHVFKIAIFVGIYFFARESFEGDSVWMLWTVVVASILVSWLGRLRGSQPGAITIWEFRETARKRRRQIPRKIRIGLLIGPSVLMIIGPSLLLNSGRFHSAWVLRRPHVDAARVKGSEEEVFLAHLTRCAGHEIDVPADRAELLERIHREKLEIDALFEAAGYHGPTREIG